MNIPLYALFVGPSWQLIVHWSRSKRLLSFYTNKRRALFLVSYIQSRLIAVVMAVDWRTRGTVDDGPGTLKTLQSFPSESSVPFYFLDIMFPRLRLPLILDKTISSRLPGSFISVDWWMKCQWVIFLLFVCVSLGLFWQAFASPLLNC